MCRQWMLLVQELRSPRSILLICKGFPATGWDHELSTWSWSLGFSKDRRALSTPFLCNMPHTSQNTRVNHGVINWQSILIIINLKRPLNYLYTDARIRNCILTSHSACIDILSVWIITWVVLIRREQSASQMFVDEFLHIHCSGFRSIVAHWNPQAVQIGAKF